MSGYLLAHANERKKRGDEEKLQEEWSFISCVQYNAPDPSADLHRLICSQLGCREELRTTQQLLAAEKISFVKSVAIL